MRSCSQSVRPRERWSGWSATAARRAWYRRAWTTPASHRSRRRYVAGEMSRRHLLMLLALAAIWGASFMFIKVAVRELEPIALVWLRIALAAVVLRVDRRTPPRPTRVVASAPPAAKAAEPATV